jgi:hypothetical protein
MPSTQFGGPIGPFLDRVQQRGVPVTVSGTCDYMSSGPVQDPAALDNEVRGRLVWSINNVIGPRMATGALTFRNLGEGTVGEIDQEIINSSGLPQMGIQVGNLAMRFAIDGGPPQREIKARIHVAGLNINASSKNGVDVGHLGNQLVNKAKSAIIWYVMGAIISAAVVGGVVWYLKRTVKKAVAESTGQAKSAWDGKHTLTCGGSDNFTISGVTSKLDGVAVTATGGCVLTLDNVSLTATTGIEAGGGAVITVKGGSITATADAVHAMGGAKVNLVGTKVAGKLEHMGGAAITGP